MNTIRKYLLISSFLIGAFTLNAQFTIVNADFESDGTSGNSSSISAWFEEAEDDDTTAEQALDADASSNIPGTGNMWGHIVNKDSGIANPAIFQNIGTWNTGDFTSYTLDMLLGDRSNQTFMSLDIEFFSVDTTDPGVPADGSSLASTFSSELLLDAASTGNPFSPESGVATFSYTQTFDFNLANLSDGDEIWLRISGLTTDGAGSQQHSLIDDLNVTPVPEPSFYGSIMGAAVLLFLLQRRRK